MKINSIPKNANLKKMKKTQNWSTVLTLDGTTATEHWDKQNVQTSQGLVKCYLYGLVQFKYIIWICKGITPQFSFISETCDQVIDPNISRLNTTSTHMASDTRAYLDTSILKEGCSNVVLSYIHEARLSQYHLETPANCSLQWCTYCAYAQYMLH
jgi:hypothetical protein